MIQGGRVLRPLLLFFSTSPSSISTLKTTRLGRVRELWEHHGDDSGAAGGVRMGAGEQRPYVPVGHQARLGCWGHGDLATRVLGHDKGAEPAGEPVPPRAGVKPPVGQWVSDPQRLELDDREHDGWRANGVLAILCGAADELPVQRGRVGDRDGDRRRCEEGQGGEAGEGADGGGERKEMKRKAMEWKEMGREATCPSGSSFLNLNEVINKVLLLPRRE